MSVGSWQLQTEAVLVHVEDEFNHNLNPLCMKQRLSTQVPVISHLLYDRHCTQQFVCSFSYYLFYNLALCKLQEQFLEGIVDNIFLLNERPVPFNPLKNPSSVSTIYIPHLSDGETEAWAD